MNSMNLLWSHLSILFSYQHNLKVIIPDIEMFFVWWALRDILLGKLTEPQDIDATCAAHPQQIWQYIEQYTDSSVDRFQTEKFGTMSLIFKEKPTPFIIEITPFRTEWTYSNVRHPDQLDRSQNIIDDSQRRDFTLNALYRYGYNNKRSSRSTKNAWSLQEAKKHYPTSPYLIDNCLIVQQHNHINELISQWTLQKSTLTNLLDQAVIISSTAQTWSKLSILLDPQLWIDDLLSWIIQTVWSPEDRFNEDALRILRWARFVISLNSTNQSIAQNSWFDFKKTTREAMKAKHALVKSLSFERIKQEIIKIFQWKNPYWYIALLNELWILDYIFPAVSATKYNHQPTRHHGFDTYSHTLLTLHALQQNKNADRKMKLAMLYHDTWKPEQYAFMENAKAKNPTNPDREWFEHHADISVRHAKHDLQRLCLSKKDINTICWYIKRHHRPWEILDWKVENIDKKLRKLLSDWDIHLTTNLIDIAIADRLWQFNPIQPPAIEQLQALKERVWVLHHEEWRFTTKELCINWNRLIREFGVEPWPAMWALLKRIFERVLKDTPERNNQNTIFAYVKWLWYTPKKMNNTK